MIKAGIIGGAAAVMPETELLTYTKACMEKQI